MNIPIPLSFPASQVPYYPPHRILGATLIPARFGSATSAVVAASMGGGRGGLGFVVLEVIKPYSFTFVNKNYLTKGNKKSRPEAACASNPKKST